MCSSISGESLSNELSIGVEGCTCILVGLLVIKYLLLFTKVRKADRSLMVVVQEKGRWSAGKKAVDGGKLGIEGAG